MPYTDEQLDHYGERLARTAWLHRLGPLADLGELLNDVRACVRNLVVYLTSETMSRPWCVGEVPTAFNNDEQLDKYGELAARTSLFQEAALLSSSSPFL